MCPEAVFTVIAFDVADDRRRRALVRVLESFGDRALESVFEAWLTPEERRLLEERALRCINASQDRLALYGLPPQDCKDVVILGSGQLAPKHAHWLL
jgi:CRISPR-associated protein Cas2